MNRFALCFIFVFSLFSGNAQEFAVKSFEAKITDMTAKLDPVLDLNGQPCALIRVAVACKGCSFSGNIVGEPQERPGEYLVYVPAGTRRLKIAHPDYLPLTYEFDMKVEKNCTYELRIALPRNHTEIPELNSQFLVLTVEPQDAAVFVNDVLQTTESGVLSKELPYGEHTYRVEAPMYHSQQGSFTIEQSGRTQLSVALNPAFGRLSVTSSPESGARVFVDGLEVGTTPYRSDRMASGSYQVQLLKEGYYPQMQTVEVEDDQTAVLDLSLTASFSLITLQAADPHAEIWVSGRCFGTGSWSGRLEAGTYSVESRCEGYEKALQSITVEAGQPQTILLQAQIPVYGVLKVNSMPVGAAVSLDGEHLGETPLITNKVLVGSHRLEVAMPDRVADVRTVEIVRDHPTEVTAQLSSVYGTVAVTSAPEGAAVRIDGREVGRTPFTSGNLDEGDHVVEVSAAGYVSSAQTVRIGKDDQAKLSFTLEREGFLYDQALAAFGSEDARTGFALLTQAAEAGDAAAQYDLGDRYYNGKGVEQDRTLGHYWWWMAARSGNEKAREYIYDTPARVKAAKGVVFGDISGVFHISSGEYSEGLAYVRPMNSFGYYMDSRGNRIIPNAYEGLPFKNGLAFTRFSEMKAGYEHRTHWSLIDKKGHTVRSFKEEDYDRISPLTESLWLVRKTKPALCYGAIDARGDVAIPVSCTEIKPFGSGKLLVSRSGKQGLADERGEMLIPAEYAEIVLFDDCRYLVKKTDGYGLVNDRGESLVPAEYAVIEQSEADPRILNVEKGGGYGLITDTGKEILPCNYQNAPLWPGLAQTEEMGVIVCLNDKYGLVDLSGNEVIPCRYRFADKSLTEEVRKRAMSEFEKKYPEKYAVHLEAAKRLRAEGLRD